MPKPLVSCIRFASRPQSESRISLFLCGRRDQRVNALEIKAVGRYLSLPCTDKLTDKHFAMNLIFYYSSLTQEFSCIVLLMWPKHVLDKTACYITSTSWKWFEFLLQGNHSCQLCCITFRHCATATSAVDTLLRIWFTALRDVEWRHEGVGRCSFICLADGIKTLKSTSFMISFSPI
jgi:hypothetical protein